jgi:IS5 family transposase
MQQWFTLSDPAMEEAFFDTPLYREFAQLEESFKCLV